MPARRSGRPVSHTSTAGASSSHMVEGRASKRRKTEADVEVVETVEDDGVYIVERILARSVHKAKLPNGRAEHLYLVRWEGYAPRDDTWEPESVVLDGAETLIRRFNARDHPFTILASRGRDPRSYHVRFGLNSPGVARSPFYQEMWMTIPALKALKCVSAEAVDRVVKAYHGGKRAPALVDDGASDEGAEVQDEGGSGLDYYDLDDDEHASDTGVDDKGRSMPKNELIEVLECTSYRAKYNSKNLTYRYRVKWRPGIRARAKAREDWLARTQMILRFGRQAASDGIREYNEKLSLEEEATSDTKPAVNEYETERMRRIQENRDMMKKLGLTL